MPEVDKIIIFNAFHILLVAIISNIFINSNWSLITNFINYMISLETPEFCYIILHMTIAYILLTSLKIEVGFYAAIKFINW